jgi:WD40 repeat protein
VCTDWNKYNPNLLVTASVDKTIKCWDIRNTEHRARDRSLALGCWSGAELLFG